MSIRTLLKFSLAAALMGLSDLELATQDQLSPLQGNDLSGLHAFDLRVGCWTIHNHVLKERVDPTDHYSLVFSREIAFEAHRRLVTATWTTPS